MKAVEFADPTLQAGFTQIPNVILRDASLSASARLTYAMLQSFAWQADECWVGQEKLGELVGVKERAIQNYLKELSAAGLVEIRRQGLNKVNRYVLFGAGLDAHVHAGPDTHGGAYEEDSREEDPSNKGPARKKVGKKIVTDDEYALASSIVASFNASAGTRLGVDPHLTPVVMRVREHPDWTAEHHRRIIAAVFAGKHWWEDPAGLEIIYGNAAQFDKSVELARRAQQKSARRVDVTAEADRIAKAQGLE